MAKTELGELYWKITGDSKQLNDSLKASESSMGKLGKIGISVGAAVVAGLAAAGTAAFKLAKDAGEAADKLLDLEQVTGIGTGTLQEFKFIAAEAGVGFEGLVGAAQKFTAKIPMIEAGTGDAAKAFEKLGVDLRDSNGELRSQDDLFPELISSLQGIENITERNAIAQQLFGRSLGDLAPVLGMTQEQFAALRLEANEVGAVLSKTALENANEFRASLDTLAVQSETTKTAVGATLAPIFQSTLIPALESVNSTLTQSANSFSEFTRSAEGIDQISDIAGRVTGSFAAIGAVSKPIFTELKDSLSTVKEPFDELNEKTSGAGVGFQLLGVATATTTGGIRVLSTIIGGSIENIINLGDALVNTAQLGGAAVDRLTGKISKEEFQDQLSATGDAFANFGTELVENYADTFSVIGDVVSNFKENSMASTEGIAEAYANSYNQTSMVVSGTLESIAEKTEETNDGIVEDALNTSGELDEIWRESDEQFNARMDARVENYKNTMNGISEATSQVGGYITSIWDSVNTFQANKDKEEIMRLEEKVAATEAGTDARASAEETLDKKKRQIARDQAKREKNSALFSAIVNTSAAVVKMLADPGGVFGLVLSGLALASGIAEIAAISSEPLPAAEQGLVIPEMPNVAPTGDNSTVRVNGGEEIVPADERMKKMEFHMYWSGKAVAKGVIEDYVNKGIYRVNMKRGIAS